MLQCEGLRDKSAHGPSNYTRVLDTESLDHLRGIIGKLGDAERLSIAG
jgi:hypothetical protein